VGLIREDENDYRANEQLTNEQPTSKRATPDRKRPPLPGDAARRIEKWREVAAATPLDVSERRDLAR
jgi:hypothetical protein